MNFYKANNFEIKLVWQNSLSRICFLTNEEFPTYKELLIPFPTDFLIQRITGSLNDNSLSLFRKRHKAFILAYYVGSSQLSKELCSIREICHKVFEYFREYFIQSSMPSEEHLFRWIRVELFHREYLLYTTGEDYAHVSIRENYERDRDLSLITSSIIAREEPRSFGKFKEVFMSVPESGFNTLIVTVLFLASAIVLVEKDLLLQKTLESFFADRYNGSLQRLYDSGSYTNASVCKYCGNLFEWKTGRGITEIPPHCGNKKCKNKHRYQIEKKSEKTDLKTLNWFRASDTRRRCINCDRVNWLDEKNICSKCFLGKR